MFQSVYAHKKVLITGNTGFKGSWLTSWLLQLDAHVYGFSNEIPTSPAMFKELSLEEKITQYWGDVTNLERTKEVINDIKPDFVFHLAAQAIVSTSYQSPFDTMNINIMGTASVLEALRLSNHPCVAVMITSDKCYDNVEWEWGYKETDKIGGKDIYSGSKGGAEIVINSYFHSFFNKPTSLIRCCSTRAGNVIGGGDWAKDRIVPDCMRAWHENKSVEIRSPKATRPWQHVLEPLSGYLQLGMDVYLSPKNHGESFNFGPAAQINQTVQELLHDLTKTWQIKDINSYRITDNIPFNEAGLLKLNCDKALLRLHWQPTLSYTSLIEFTGGWYYAFYKEQQNMFTYTMQQIEQYSQLAIEKQLPWTK